MTGPDNGPARRRVAIVGSCVSRDTVESAGPDAFDVVVYIARQSLASFDSDAAHLYPESAVAGSPFQERMIRGDFAGDLARRLEEAKAADLVLVDIVDERHGVHLMPDGGVITRSIDALAIPEIRAELDRGRHVPFGGPEHYALWSEGAIRLAGLLSRLGLLERTVVLQVPWATVSSEGAPTPESMGMGATTANRLSKPYYSRLRELGFCVLEIDAAGVVADSDHRWGLAPFHYAASVYREILERLG